MACEAGLDQYSGSPPVPGVDNPGFFLRLALAERRFLVHHGAITTAEQKEMEAFFVPDRIKYFPLTPQWWDVFEEPSGMVVRFREVPALRESVMIKGSVGAAVMGSLYICKKVATAFLLTEAVRHISHLWLIPLPLVEVIRRLTPSVLCPGNPEMAALSEAALNLVEQVHRSAKPFLLGSAEHPHGVVRCSRTLTPEGVL